MKRNEKKRFLIIGSFFTILVLNAQEQTLDCNYNIQEALFHLKGSNTIEKDNLKAVEFLKPCLEAQSANAQLIMGHLYLNSSQDEEDIHESAAFLILEIRIRLLQLAPRSSCHDAHQQVGTTPHY